MNRIRNLVLVLLGLLAFSATGFGQIVLSQTTLASEMTVGVSGASSGLGQSIFATTMNVTSATNISQAFNGQPETMVYIDNEVMGVLNLVTGSTTVFNVLRGQMGTKASSHAANAVVLIQIVSPEFSGAGSGGFKIPIRRKENAPRPTPFTRLG